MYELTPADVMDLRASVRWPLADPSVDGPQTPYITYAREGRMALNAPGFSEEAFALYVRGHIRAISTRPEVLGACLRCEYAEPGFIDRILNPAVDCETVTLNPDERALLESRRRFEAKRDREAAEAAARTARKPSPTKAPRQPDPKTLTLDDLFDD